ncbi:unnamed protein product [Rotaria sp. Silwood1]|nr:unnamed protein product [Rotaria sp. Silwood1]CAF3733684.1 unnamed protein product [Rotaria sp. Silwood1]CAF3819553.1 unnamed protein product [Rotaria sp. Silwood1]
MAQKTWTDLPPELLYHILDCVDIQTIFSIRLIFKNFRQFIDNYNKIILNYDSAFSNNYDVIRRVLQPKNVSSLTIADNLYTVKDPNRSIDKIFNNIRQFTQLRSLILDNIDDNNMNFLLQNLDSKVLVTLSIRANEWKNINIWSVISSTIRKWPIRKLVLENFQFTSVNIEWPINEHLQYLYIGTCELRQYLQILNHLTHLKILIIEDWILDSMDKTSSLSCDFNRNTVLQSLTVKDFSLSMEELELFLSPTPSLTHLKLISQRKKLDSFLDGFYLKQLLQRRLPLLKKFEFFFYYVASSPNINNIPSLKSLIKPFRERFWLEEKHCSVYIDFIFRSQTLRIYTKPVKLSEEYNITNNSDVDEYPYFHNFYNWHNLIYQDDPYRWTDTGSEPRIRHNRIYRRELWRHLMTGNACIISAKDNISYIANQSVIQVVHPNFEEVRKNIHFHQRFIFNL